jgi:hypothetical protein
VIRGIVEEVAFDGFRAALHFSNGGIPAITTDISEVSHGPDFELQIKKRD